MTLTLEQKLFLDFIPRDDFLENLNAHPSDSLLLEHTGVDLTRYSKDNSANNFGYKLLDLCKNLNVYITNGRFGVDKGIGNLTCKGVSIVD